MPEEITQKKKIGFIKRLLKRCLLSPINTIFALTTIYFILKVYMFDASISNQILLFGTVALWVFWFIAKKIFILMIIIALAGSGAYLYYNYSRQEQIKCEESGGYWNSNTKTCEAKRSLWEKMQQFFTKQTPQSSQANASQDKDTLNETKEQNK